MNYAQLLCELTIGFLLFGAGYLIGIVMARPTKPKATYGPDIDADQEIGRQWSLNKSSKE